jgi:hypothetical protein
MSEAVHPKAYPLADAQVRRIAARRKSPELLGFACIRPKHRETGNSFRRVRSNIATTTTTTTTTTTLTTHDPVLKLDCS